MSNQEWDELAWSIMIRNGLVAEYPKIIAVNDCLLDQDWWHGLNESERLELEQLIGMGIMTHNLKVKADIEATDIRGLPPISLSGTNT